MQGLFTGDLGDIGPSSINETRLIILCKLLLSDASLEAYATSSIAIEQDHMNKMKISSARLLHKHKKYRKAHSCLIEWVPLVRRQRRYLELCAKVLRCSQRTFLVKAEIESMQNVSEALNTSRKNKNCRGLKSCQKNNVFLESPFMKVIAMECFGQVISALQAHHSTPSSPSPDVQYSFLSQSDYITQTSERSKSDILSKLPLAQAIRIENFDKKSFSKSKLVACLQVLSASAEAFPRGECWASCNSWKEMYEHQIKYINVCEGSDLSFLIFSLSLLLQAYGGINGDIRVQTWVLICLLKLSDATKVWLLYCDEDKEQVESIALSWKNVWDQLLHPDLRYQSYTSYVYESTLGEIVIMLLGEIVRNNFTEPNLLHLSHGKQSTEFVPSAFVTENQRQIWNLPFFAQASCICSSAAFDLTIAVLNRSILEDEELDLINSKSSTRYEDLNSAKSRKYRIAYFCIDFILDAIKKKNTVLLRKTAPFVCAAYRSLFDSISTFYIHWTVYSMQASRYLRITEIRNLFCTNHGRARETNNTALWIDSIHVLSFAQLVENNETVWNKFSGDRIIPTIGYIEGPELNGILSNLEKYFDRSNSRSANIKSIEMQKLMLDVLSAIFKPPDWVEDEDDGTTSFGLQSVMVHDQALALKCLLDIVASNDCIPDYVIEEFLQNLLHQFIEESVKSYRSNSYTWLSLDILGIIRFVYGDILLNKMFPKPLLGAKIASQLYDCCKIVLENLVGSTSSAPTKTENLGSKVKINIDDVFLGSDDDGSMTQNCRKRKLSFSSDGSEFDAIDGSRFLVKERGDQLIPRAQSQTKDNESESVLLIAAIMCILSPTNKTAQFVANIIIEHSCIASSSDNADPYDCISCVGIFNQCYHFSVDNGNDSSAAYRLSLELIRRTRDLAPDTSPFHLSGFLSCSEVFKNRIKQSDSVSISREEIDETIKILMNHSREETRSLNMRPIMKERQIMAATEIFMNADADFNKVFGEIFAISFVIESLKDLSTHVRRAGIYAIGAALIIFPHEAHEKISKDVLKAFPSKPLLHNNESKQKKTFQQFVLSKNMKSDSDFHELERRAWNENRSALEFDKLVCIGKIGCQGTDTIAIQMFTHLVWISIHYSWTFKSFSMMEHISRSWKYESLEHYLSERQYAFIQQWIKGGNALSNLPISFTSPKLVRQLLRLQYVKGELKLSDEFQKLSGLTIDDYIDENVSVLVPCIFVVFASSFDNDSYDFLLSLESVSPNEDEKTDSLEELIREISFVCTGGEVGRLIKGHYHDIFAHVIPIRFIEVDRKHPFRKSVDNLLKCISTFTKTPQKTLLNRSGSIALTLIKNASNSKHFYHGFEISLENVFDSLIFLAKEIRNKANSTEDVENIFYESHTNVTECILCTRAVMDTSLDVEKKILAWSMIDRIIEQVMNQETSTPELGFCLTSILNIAKLTMSNDSIRFRVLNRLKSFISFCVGQIPLPSQISSVLNASASMIIYLHGEYLTSILRKVVESLKSKTYRRLFKLDKTKGDIDEVISFLTFNEIEIRALEEHNQEIEAEMDCLSVLFDSITLLLDPKIIVKLEAHQELGPFTRPKISQSSITSLIQLNPKADLSHLVTIFNDAKTSDSGSSDLAPSVTQFIKTCKRFRGEGFGVKSNVQLYSYLEQGYLSALERLMYDLRGLKSKQSKQQFTTNESDSNDLERKLKEELVLLLDSSYSINVRTKALKCLGELDLSSQVTNACESPVTDADILQNPLPNVYNAAFSLLSDLLQSECTETAIAAMETTKGLMCTKEGWRSWHEHSKTSTVKETLSPFVKKYISEHCSNLTVSNDFLSMLCKRYEVNEHEIFQNKEWCWNETLWCLKEGETPQFDIWIKCLVCAIILCCYDKSEDGKSSMVKGKSDFFSACLVLSSRKFLLAHLEFFWMNSFYSHI